MSVAPNKNYCHLVEYVCERSDRARKQRRVSLLKVLNNLEGVEEKGKEKRSAVGESQGLFSSTLYPGTDLCWLRRGVASLAGVAVLSLALPFDCTPLS